MGEGFVDSSAQAEPKTFLLPKFGLIFLILSGLKVDVSNREPN